MSGERGVAKGSSAGVLADAARSEAGIFSILSQYAVMQVVLAGTAVVRNKIVAYRLGPAAFGEITQIAAVVAVAGTVVSFGMGVSLARNVARAKTLEERQSHLANANGIVLSLALVAVGVMAALLASGHLMRFAALPQDRTTVWTSALFIAGVPVTALQTNYLALLQGILDARGLAVSRSVAVLLATVASIPLVWFLGFMGAAIQLVLLSAVVAGLLGWRCHALGYAPLRVRLERKPVVYLGSFGLMSVASGFAQGLSDASVRGALIACAGATANGLLQAPYVLAITVRGVILASIGSVSLATIAPQTDRGEISRAVDRLLNVVLPLGVTALGLLGLLGAYAMTLLYSHAFAAGAAFLPYMLAADLLLVFIWVIGAPVLAAGDRVLWLLLDLLFAATRWGVAILLMRRMDSLAVVLGILAGVALHCALNLAVYRFRYRLELSAKHLIRLLLGIGFVAALSLAGAGTVRPAVTGVAFVAWGGYVVYHSRKNGIFAALQQRVRRDGAHETGAPGFPPAG